MLLTHCNRNVIRASVRQRVSKVDICQFLFNTKKGASPPARRSTQSRSAVIRVTRNTEKAFISFFQNTAKVKSLKSLVLGKPAALISRGQRVLSMRDHLFVSNEPRYQAAFRASRVRLSEPFRNGTYCSYPSAAKHKARSKNWSSSRN